jgi:hypothetical protein
MSRWLIAAALLLAPSAHPDFSGRWLLNAGKSDLGPNAVKPPRYEMEIVQSETALTMKATVATPAGEQVKEYKVSLNGYQSEREIEGGGKVLTKAHWQGDRIVIEQSLNGAFPVTETWSLSPDRKVLTSTRTADGQPGAPATRMVFDRLTSK